ncbi:MAG TPA: hypothetical protein GXX15_03590 [Clostridia bacterium]|nr:hypothetical protein [Clostridia bacterium]
MRKILALAIVIALAVTGYQIYKDDNKRMALEEKVRGVLYSIGTGASRTSFYSPDVMKEKTELQPMVDEYVKKYYDKEIRFILENGTKLSGKIKNVVAIEYTSDDIFAKKGDLALLGTFAIDSFESHTLPTRVLNFTDNKVYLGKVTIKEGKIMGSDVEKMGKPFILGVVDSIVRDIIIADEITKYTKFDSLETKFLMNDRILIDGTAEGDTNGGRIAIKINNKFNGKPVYISSYFESKDGFTFYEIKRESNVKEYVEWAKKNL